MDSAKLELFDDGKGYVEGEMTVVGSHNTTKIGEPDFNTLDEPIRDTILRDLKAVGIKFAHVLFPKEKKTLLKEWDLWGPLLLCTFMAMILQGSSTAVNSNDGGPEFAEVFVIVWIGSMVVTLNSKLLGGNISFFQSVCVLGYCLLPTTISLVVCRIILLTGRSNLLFFIRFTVSMIGFAWATYASMIFLGESQKSGRKLLAVYPIGLFYFIISWFVVYKLPEIKHHHKLLKAGVAYTYMTSEDYSSWKFSNYSINATNSIIANTLQNFYSNEKDFMYILYNDQPPNRKSKANKGHNKGVVMANNTSGFWLVHSVPHFPETGVSYIFPRTGAVFGQSFLCISMDLNNLNNVGIQLQYNEPEIYGQDINSNLKNSLPDLAKAAANVTIQNAPWYHVMNIVSRKGTQFLSFAKTRNFNKDLYEDLVAPSLETDLFVETWPNGPGRLQSNCTKRFKVNNVKSVFVNSANVSFTTTNDHSKWAVSPPSPSKNWLCIGDINRAEHQKVRGGGTVCLDNKQIATDFNKCVETIEECSKITS